MGKVILILRISNVRAYWELDLIISLILVTKCLKYVKKFEEKIHALTRVLSYMNMSRVRSLVLTTCARKRFAVCVRLLAMC